MRLTLAKARNVPALRFREFVGEWGLSNLGSLGSFLGGGTPAKNTQEFWAGNIPWVSSSDIKEESIRDISYSRQITEEAVSKSATKIIPTRSILIVSRVGVGKVAINDIPICTSQDFINLIPKAANSVFLAYLIKQKTTKLLSFNQGTSIKGFVKDDLASLRVGIPKTNEQQKVAGFLTAVDSRISALQDKKKLVEKYKKSVIQAIFSQKIRFKDKNGKNYPDWESSTFGFVYFFLRTNSLSRAELSTSGTIKSIHYGDIHMHLATNFDSSREAVGFVTEQNGFDFCGAGDLVIADASEDRLDVGKAVEIIKTNGDKIIAGLHTFLARPRASTVVVGFSGYLMQSRLIRKQLRRIATGASVLGISKTELSKLKFSLPSKEEQQDITGFLTLIDEKIDLTEEKLKQTKRFKKVLHQRLFV